MKNYIATLAVLLLGISLIHAQCRMVTSISENFETSNNIPKCWEEKSGLSMVYVKKNRVTFYSLMTPKEDMFLIAPKLKAGKYTVSLDISDNGGISTLELVAMQNNADKKSYTSLGKATEIKNGKRVQTIQLKKDAHLALKVVLNDMHQAVYVDNVNVQAK